MIQSSAGQRRSSSKRKKSQKNLAANATRPTQRLILHPPKPPQQPKLVLRSSRQSISSRTMGDWTSFSLVGNGADASYHYGDICTVQAIMRFFNGRSSTPSIIEEGEHRHEDVAMAAVSQVDDRTRAEQEMNDILQEALDCHHCDYAINFDPEVMDSDIQHGIYRCSEDPPFVLNRPSEEIAPDELPQVVWEPGYLQLATTAQQEKYLELVTKHIDRNRETKLFADKGNVDQGYESKFAFYCVDFHIHQHYLHRRSALNLCRTNDEMDDYRYWKYRLALWTAHHYSSLRPDAHDMGNQANDLAHDTTPSVAAAVTAATKPMSLATTESEPIPTNLNGNPCPSPPSSSSATSTFSSPLSCPSTAASSPPGPSSFRLPPPAVLPWPKQEFSISSQITLHRRLNNPRERAAHVRAAHKRFQNIMKTRALQRREGLARAEHEAAIAWQRWHQGKDAPLAISRDGDIGKLLQYYDR